MWAIGCVLYVTLYTNLLETTKRKRDLHARNRDVVLFKVALNLTFKITSTGQCGF